MENAIEIKYVELPPTINGFCHWIRDNEYLIVINSTANAKQQERTLKHEMLHIELNHFNRSISATECEKEVKNIMNKN